ncbi:PREDICTED: probable C-terminal domain small phosphatase [Tarenaya hassleriana]|uniref:probable C-terminal domain small phosphatase n=1 Tax=Tarenaya hassleriana TaxID=28532 RepID=UPI00053C5A70|nr:PREDICTED: probable C-terminal domain small phosphatase [Tarenaya hassleriana]
MASEGNFGTYRPSSSSAAATAVAAGSFLASLHKSIFTFHSRLLRCFSRLFGASASAKQGCKKSEKISFPPLLVESTSKKLRTVVLDLDETLVHSTVQPPKVKFDFMVRVRTEGMVIPVFVVKRPGLDKFLERIGENFKVAIFTAGISEYASQVLDKLDMKHVISQRLYRDSCKEVVTGKYVKDLSLVEGNDLGNVLMVDDNPFSFSLHPENGLPIKPFVDDMKDRELMKLVEFFDGCDQYEDMRAAAKRFLTKQL